MQLHHDFAQKLPHLVRPTEGEEQPNPQMVILNEELATKLGLDPDWLRSSEGVDFLTGRAGGHAMAYSGFQFGAFNPQMGDGRAMLLGAMGSPCQGNWTYSLFPPRVRWPRNAVFHAARVPSL